MKRAPDLKSGIDDMDNARSFFHLLDHCVAVGERWISIMIAS